jgi:hypothetical protein
MSTATTKDLEELSSDYKRKVAEIRADDSLSWEKQVLRIRELGLRYDAERRKIEENGGKA